MDFTDTMLRDRILGCPPCRKGDFDHHQVDFMSGGVVLLCMHPHRMQVGHVYYVRYRIEGMHRYDRAMVASYVGIGGPGADEHRLIFSGRPWFGTTSMEVAWLKSWHEVETTTKRYANRRA